MRFPPRSAARRRGTALLEAILALALFVTAAAIVTSGMSASTDNLDRQRRNTHAANLAATVLAEIQLGIRSTAEAGEQPFAAPFEQWTAELVVTPTETAAGEASGLLRVEVIIRHQDSALVRRLAQVIRVPETSVRTAAF
jgi:type II secretory pathway pseudopilin PulG